MNDETELQNLLAEHDAADRPMRPEERSRLLDRLGIDSVDDGAAQPAVPEEQEPTLVEISARPGSSIETGAARPKRLPLPAIAAALIALLALLAGLALTGNRQEPSVNVVDQPDLQLVPTPAPTSTPAPMPTPAPPPTCPASVAEFVAAVDAWDGVDQWASLIDERRPDPDLPTLAAGALDDWRQLDPDDPLHAHEVSLDDVVAEAGEDRRATFARRSEPIQLTFDNIRLASSQVGSPLSPCAADIEIVAAELGLPAP